MISPAWFEILVHFDRKRYISNGLTAPFLIGGGTVLKPEQTILSVEKLIEQASNKSLPRPITIIRCGNIREFVIGILDFETAAMRMQYNSMYREIDNIIFPDSSLDMVTNIQELKSKLSEIYQPLVDNKEFSKNAGVWGDFTVEDKNRILEIKEK